MAVRWTAKARLLTVADALGIEQPERIDNLMEVMLARIEQLRLLERAANTPHVFPPPNEVPKR